MQVKSVSGSAKICKTFLNLNDFKKWIGRCIQDPVKYIWWSPFAKTVNGFSLLTVFVRSSILDDWWGSEYGSGIKAF